MKTEITSKGVETKQSDKDQLSVEIDMFLKGVNVLEAISQMSGLADAVRGLVEQVDHLSVTIANLEAEIKAIKEDDKRDDQTAADLAKKVDVLAASKVKAAPAAKTKAD